jgi:tetratricopeptide (TPR) repeat protein
MKEFLKIPWLISISSGIIGIIIYQIFLNAKRILWDKKKKKLKIENLITEANKLLDESGEFEISLQKFDQILDKFNKKDFPESYGIIQRGKGVCYLKLSQLSNDEQFLNLSINYLCSALEIFKAKKRTSWKGKISNEYKCPLQLAITEAIIAIAYAGLSNIRDKKEYLEKAISAFKESLEIDKLYGMSDKYADSSNNLGTYYSRMAELGQREKYLIKAASCFEEALKSYDLGEQRGKYLSTLIKIATNQIYLSKASNRKENILIAINRFEEALNLIDVEKDGAGLYCEIQNGLGSSYVELARFENREDNIDMGLKAFTRALETINEKDVKGISMIKQNTGIAYRELAKIRYGKENLKKAIALYRESLNLKHIREYPLDYANLQIHMGEAVGELAGFEDDKELSKKDILQSIDHFQNAKSIFTQENYPLRFISICNNLASCYIGLSLITKKHETLQKSIEYSRKVLSMTNPEDSLFEYAKAFLNLGIAHFNLNNLTVANNYLQRVIRLLEEEKTDDYRLAKEILGKIEVDNSR